VSRKLLACQPALTAKLPLGLAHHATRSRIIGLAPKTPEGLTPKRHPYRTKEKTMSRIARPALRIGDPDNGQPRNGPPEETPDDNDALELPVEPDEGTPLIPDDERVVNVPS
jgi:hypothetical protein